MKSNDKEPLASRICRALDLPAEAAPGSTRVEICGRSSAKICGGGAILLYSPEEIRIALRRDNGYVSVKGFSLCCESYNMGAVGIRGRIVSVSFEGEQEE